MSAAQAEGGPSVSARGIAALRSTRGWAFVVGITALIGSALAAVNAIVYGLVIPFAPPANAPPYFSTLIRGMVIVGAVIGMVIYGLSGWFALQYGRGIDAGLRGADANRLETALWWQRRYWTFQGVLMIILIVLYVLGFVAAIIVGVMLAVHHQGHGV